MKTNQNNEKTVPTQEQIEAACRQSARHFWNWLTWSLVYYVVINLFLTYGDIKLVVCAILSVANLGIASVAHARIVARFL